MCLLGTSRIRTTAYHPAVNGLVERLHCQLKAGLITCVPRSEWIDALPHVLLGIRTCLKEDLGSSTAKLVYGTSLRLPGEFFVDSKEIADPACYVSRLRTTMQQLHPVPTTHHSHRTPHVSKELASSTHVFVRKDALRKSLQPPYDGPFHQVLHRSREWAGSDHITGSLEACTPQTYPIYRCHTYSYYASSSIATRTCSCYRSFDTYHTFRTSCTLA